MRREAPLDGASLFAMAAQTCGSGSLAELVALESVGRLRLSRAPHVEFKFLPGSGPSSIGRAVAYIRRVAKERGNFLAKALAQELEFTLEASRISCAPFFPRVRGAGPPRVCPEWMSAAMGIPRTVSQVSCASSTRVAGT